ncbi:hypothetical protein HYG86_05130 [Alkalicella caledoniensis]|uniref:Uncharacterized protein n=1 Tax=Alkalicella caledoniensis TaxID=2731377 RepID=A0A7G9W685_ALKCA|nr:hypothetical protein [Alkalicella caledoniensis]QNO14197.1 hypothetical protein HYG86_05130 [Alkalicella caledoniensis]
MGLFDLVFSKKKQPEVSENSFALFIVPDESKKDDENMDIFWSYSEQLEDYSEIGRTYDLGKDELLKVNNTISIDKTPCFILTQDIFYDEEDIKNMLYNPLVHSDNLQDVIDYLEHKRNK